MANALKPKWVIEKNVPPPETKKERPKISELLPLHEMKIGESILVGEDVGTFGYVSRAVGYYAMWYRAGRIKPKAGEKFDPSLHFVSRREGEKTRIWRIAFVSKK